jgi:hypothetical protein
MKTFSLTIIAVLLFGSVSCKDDKLCANGDCTCEAGSSCVLECPDGNPGAQGCRFTQCEAGEAEVCDDGIHTVCGAACPSET